MATKSGSSDDFLDLSFLHQGNDVSRYIHYLYSLYTKLNFGISLEFSMAYPVVYCMLCIVALPKLYFLRLHVNEDQVLVGEKN